MSVAGLRTLLGCLLLWIGLVLPAQADAADVQPLDLTDSLTSASVIPHAILLEDAGATWSVDEVMARRPWPDRLDNHQETPSFGFTRAAYWLVFTITSRTEVSTEWQLVFNDALMGRIDTWVVRASGERRHQVSGATVPMQDRPLHHRTHVFPVSIATGEHVEVYMRVASGLAVVLPVSIERADHFLETSNRQTWFYALYFGVTIAMFLYNGFLYLSLRDTNYLYYALFMASMFMYYGMFDGFSIHLVPWLPPSWVQPTFVATLLLSGISSLVFALAFIPLRHERPWLYWAMVINIAIEVVGLLLLCFIEPILPAIIGTVCGMLCAVLSITAGYFSARTGYEPARYFFVAWLSLCLSSVIFGFRTLSWVDSNPLTDHIQQVGSAVEMILLSFALAARMRVMKKEKEDMQALAISNMERADKLKDEFLANTSHELRTPLNGIIGLAEASLHDASRPLDEATRDALRMIVSSGRRLGSLVNDILDFSKLRHEDIVLSCHAIDVRALVDVVLALSKPLVKGRPVVLKNAIPEGLSAVMADENRLQQILHNLIGNAIKFTREGSVTIESFLQENRIHIAVVDTGIGIPADRLGQVFDSFNQGDGSIQREFGGTGLGLSITRKLVELHGGTITVTSTPGEGSRFVFDLPVASHEAQVLTASTLSIRDDEPRETVLRQSPAMSSVVSQWILVVDDEPINREVLKAQLSSAGFGVVEAVDGDDALARLAERASGFDLVLLDVMMPRRSGFDTCIELRKTWPALQLPVIFLTAKSQTKDVLAGFEAGGNDYLVKPFSRDELLARMRIHLELVTTHKLIQSYSKNLEQRVADRTHELVSTQQQLVLKQKMAALGVLTAGVAHEINNPNNFVRAALQNVEAWRTTFFSFIEELADGDAEVVEAFSERLGGLQSQLSLIDEGSRRIDRIVSGLRVVTRVDEVDQAQPADVIEGLEQTIALLAPSFPADVEVTQALAARATIECYPAEINQVFMNVLLNAVHAIEDKRAIDPAGSYRGSVHLGSDIDGGQLVVRLRDDGIGMTDDVLARACDPFFTTRGVGQGAGLGLSISRDIMHKHGGTMAITSSPGIGTTIVLRFATGQDGRSDSAS